jgi:alpha-ketoglutarate-dependent taurine dioxygenase
MAPSARVPHLVFLLIAQLAPAQQRDLGAYFGEVEVHPSAPQVPGLPGVSIIWDALRSRERAVYRQSGRSVEGKS